MLYGISFSIVHALHQDNYVSRINLMDVSIQNLTTNKKMKIKCFETIIDQIFLTEYGFISEVILDAGSGTAIFYFSFLLQILTDTSEGVQESSVRNLVPEELDLVPEWSI